MINQKVQNEGSYSGKFESKKKLKKVRSIRLARLSSMRSSTATRGGKNQYDNLSILSSDETESLEQPTPFEVVDASPNYMKGTSSSHAKDNFQITEKPVTRKILTRVSTLKLKRSMTRKNRKNDNDDGNMSKRVIARRLSLKPVRILNRIPTFKSKKGSKISHSQDSRLHKSTCSSALKGSHFNDHIDVPQEGSSSQGESSKKVCPYSYCSLHGYRHENSPPLKRFVSMRRHQLKSQQKSVKTDGRSKQFGNARKVTQETKSVYSEDGNSDLQNRSDFEVADEIEWNDKNMINDERVSVESTSKDVVKFSVSEGKNIEPDCEVLQKRDQKYIKMWHLMYKNAVLSNTGKCENMLSFDENDKKGKEEDALTFNGGNYCETDQDMDDEKKNVIELVQKAFDEILLPEAEDLYSLVPSLSEKNEGTREERNANGSAFTESPEEAMKTETKSEQRAPKSWSHLKKVILLKRFVKALEKVRNVNLRRPRQLPLDANFEAEKVLLKQQTAEERKKAEEWMLDYALQNVISKLAPAQRQRVTLLIEAFETILPTQDAENGSPRADPIQSHDASLYHSKEETDKGRDYVYSAMTFLGKAPYSHNSTIEFAANASDNQMPELHNPIELRERFLDYLETEKNPNKQASSGVIEEDLDGKQSLASSYNNGKKISIDNDNIYHVEEARIEEIVNEVNDEEARTHQIVNEVPEDLISILNTENPNIKSESPVKYSETKNVISGNKEQFSVSKSLLLNGLVRSLRSNLVGSESPLNVLDEPTIDRKEMTEKAELETEILGEFPTKQQSETQQKKQGNNGLWYMVYKHMVSDATENNSMSLTDGADEKESRNEGDRTSEASVLNESTPVNVINQDMHLKDRVSADSDVELRQLETIKMVEEAIDSILPDVQDNSSINSEGSNQKEESVESGNGTGQEQEAEELVTKEGSKPNKPMSRSWSNLKKVILLRRFIKALEKVRKFNPRGPRFLPVEDDPEGEKVELRHQDMAERKGTEEWMLDYALRQVVSKLTPARKRKVELLVEAFETVVPTIKN